MELTDAQAPPSDNQIAVSPGRGELIEFIRRHVGLTVGGLAVFAALGAGLNYFFDEEIRAGTHWIAEHFGIWGMGGLLFVSDTIISPLPPDLLLLIVAKSPMRAGWWFYVSVLGVISMCGGHLGWAIGRRLGDTHIAARLFGSFREGHRDIVRRYGAWAVILGAATPLPFSVTCWTAGLLKMKWTVFALAALVRIPRFLLYYLVIHASV